MNLNNRISGLAFVEIPAFPLRSLRLCGKTKELQQQKKFALQQQQRRNDQTTPVN